MKKKIPESTRIIKIERNDSLTLEDENGDKITEINRMEFDAEYIPYPTLPEPAENLPMTIAPISPQIDPLQIDPLQIDHLRPILGEIGYPFASGEIQKRGCSNNQVCAVSGVIRGIDFEEFYCRAAAFAGGQQMPKFNPAPVQNYEVMQFWRSRRPFGLDAIYVKSDEFILSGSLFADKRILKGRLTLSLNAPRRFSCDIGGGWYDIVLPLNCAARRNETTIGCSLDFKTLIESLTGVAAKTTEPERRQKIETLRENLIDRFRNRIYDRTKIEEYDLRDMF
ncbi:hypothetical protein FACS189487_10820 [Campylobacterota bacterium]|nr:hypothetical protein FACS189487_10820 [Campylobacterota bacterium]